MIPGPIPSYIATGAGGRPVQIHLVNREAPSFPHIADLLEKARAQPPSDPFQVLELEGELAVVTGGLPSGMGFEEWIGDAVSRVQSPPPSGNDATQTGAEEGYTQFFQPPQDPPATQPQPTEPVAPPPTVASDVPAAADSAVAPPDFSEFFQTPLGQSPPTSSPEPGKAPGEADSGGYTAFFQAAGSGTPTTPPTAPAGPSPPVEPPAPRLPTSPQTPPPATPEASPPPSQQVGPPPRVPTQPTVPVPPPPAPLPPQPPVYPHPQAQAPVTPPPGASVTPPAPTRPPAREPDPDSITAEFRKPMPSPPPQQGQTGKGRNWAPSQRGTRHDPLAMGDYLARLDSSSGSPMPSAPRPPATPAAPSWASDSGAPVGYAGKGGPSAPTVVTRAPAPPGGGATPTRGFQKRDLVIFGTVIGLVIVAAIVTVVVVILTAD